MGMVFEVTKANVASLGSCGGLSMSVDIADQCGFRLEMVTMPLPETEVPSDFKNADQYLRLLVLKCGRRWSTHVTAHHHAQIEENYR